MRLGGRFYLPDDEMRVPALGSFIIFLSDGDRIEAIKERTHPLQFLAERDESYYTMSVLYIQRALHHAHTASAW